MSVEQVYKATDELVEAARRLIPQLSSSAKPLSAQELTALLDQGGTHLFVFRDEGTICGMLTLVTFLIPTGRRGIIEDVVVDDAARGKGAGRALVEAALEKARELGLKNVDLTSRPSREAANRLYVRCGFEQRQTNVYRYSL